MGLRVIFVPSFSPLPSPPTTCLHYFYSKIFKLLFLKFSSVRDQKMVNLGSNLPVSLSAGDIYQDSRWLCGFVSTNANIEAMCCLTRLL